MRQAFAVTYDDDGIPSKPVVARTSMVLTEDDYRQRIEFLEEWNNMPSETTIERAARLAFRQKKGQGYRLNKQYRVHEAR